VEPRLGPSRLARDKDSRPAAAPAAIDEVTKMRVLLSILGVGLLAGASAACGTTTASPTPTPTPTPTAVASPTADVKYHVNSGSGALVLRISVGGGFIAPASQLTQVPTLALYGDGRIIIPGPPSQTLPSPLLPNTRVVQVTPAEIQKILTAADAAGLLGPDASFDVLGASDAGTTVFRTVVDGKTHNISAYALGIKTPADNGADPTVVAARAKLSDFAESMADLATFLGRQVTDTAYAPAAMRLYIGSAGPADPSVSPAPQTLAWPLSSDPATVGDTTVVPSVRCVAVTGADLTTFVTAASAANLATVWTAPSGRYTIGVRPVYPDESGC
jgi:hypothetical protein